MAFYCPNCKKEKLVKQEHQYYCSPCNIHYPIVNQIPIFVNNTAEYFPSMYAEYYLYTKDKEREAQNLSTHYTDIKEALFFNNQLIIKNIEPLRNRFDVTDLLNILPSFSNRTARQNSLKDLRYLARDWAGISHNELEVQTIVEAIKGGLKDIYHPQNEVLFFGSGVGRVSLEIAQLFEKAYATDLSFSMLHFLSSLYNQDIEYIQTTRTNQIASTKRCLKQTASMGSFLSKGNKFNIIPFVSDVANSPFVEGALDMIFSIYFTDVMDVDSMLAEVKRLLKPNGHFIHFGPLGYQGGFQKTYATDEIVDLFREYGFVEVSTQFVPTSHLNQEESMEKVSFNNWMVVFQKKELNIDEVFDENLTFHINEQLSMTSSTVYQDTVAQSYHINLRNRSYTIPDFMYQVLNEIRTALTTKELNDLIKEQLQCEDASARDFIIYLIEEQLIISKP